MDYDKVAAAALTCMWLQCFVRLFSCCLFLSCINYRNYCTCIQYLFQGFGFVMLMFALWSMNGELPTD